MCIAIRLQFVLQCVWCPYALRKGKHCQYSSHLYRSTPPICIAIPPPPICIAVRLVGKSWWLWSPECSPVEHQNHRDFAIRASKLVIVVVFDGNVLTSCYPEVDAGSAVISSCPLSWTRLQTRCVKPPGRKGTALPTPRASRMTGARVGWVFKAERLKRVISKAETFRALHAKRAAPVNNNVLRKRLERGWNFKKEAVLAKRCVWHGFARNAEIREMRPL